MLYTSSMITRRLTALSVIVTLTSLAPVTASTIVTPAFAIKRFFNCMTDVANKHGKLDLTDVNNCYDKETTLAHMRLTAIQTVIQAAVVAVALVAAALLVLTQVRALGHISTKPIYHVDRK
jgi:hypothetical protein